MIAYASDAADIASLFEGTRARARTPHNDAGAIRVTGGYNQWFAASRRRGAGHEISTSAAPTARGGTQALKADRRAARGRATTPTQDEGCVMEPLTLDPDALIAAVLKQLSAAPMHWFAEEIAGLEQAEELRKQRCRDRYRAEARRQRQP